MSIGFFVQLVFVIIALSLVIDFFVPSWLHIWRPGWAVGPRGFLWLLLELFLLWIVYVVVSIFFLGSPSPVHAAELYAQQATAPVSIPNTEALSTKELWSLAVGTLMPLLIAVPMQPNWPAWTRAVFGFVACSIAAAVTAWLDGALATSGTDAILRSALMVLIASWSSYTALWKNTVAPHIEAATALTAAGRRIGKARLQAVSKVA